MSQSNSKRPNVFTVHENKKAIFDYEIIQSYEAGIKLMGNEVKAVRLGQCNLKGSFVSIQNGIPTIKGMHLHSKSGDSKYDKRDRIILLKKHDIIFLSEKLKEKGLSIIPIEIYFKGNLIKIKVALSKGRKVYEKKQVLKERDILFETKRELGRL